MIYQSELSTILKREIEQLDLLKRVLTCNAGEPAYQNRIIEFKGIPAANLDTLSTKFIYWTQYSPKDLGLNTRDIKLPFDNYTWWCIKTMPGQFLPIHVDPYVKYSKEKTTRYCAMLQDYIPGHCFIIEDELFTNYKAGDVFLWNESSVEHGAFNMSGVPRVSLQIGIGSKYDEVDNLCV